MKHLLLYSLSACILFSCAEEKKKPREKVPVKSDALIIGDPLDCGLDSLLIFPLGSSYYPEVVNPEEPAKDSDIYGLANGSASRTSKISLSANTTAVYYDKTADVEYINDNSNDYDIRNLLFYDMYTQETHPLVLDSLHILSFAVHKEYERDLIFYRVVKTDFNDDKKYNSLDPVMLYVSDLDGRNFTQITPEDQHFLDYTFYKETQSIMIKTVLDSDNNKAFMSNDETSFSSMKIMEPAKAVEIFSADLKKSLRSYLK